MNIGAIIMCPQDTIEMVLEKSKEWRGVNVVDIRDQTSLVSFCSSDEAPVVLLVPSGQLVLYTEFGENPTFSYTVVKDIGWLERILSV